MIPLNTLEKLFLKGRITQEAYWEQKAAHADKIIALLEAELAEAYELHEQARGKDAQEALVYILKATTITHLLEEISN